MHQQQLRTITVYAILVLMSVTLVTAWQDTISISGSGKHDSKSPVSMLKQFQQQTVQKTEESRPVAAEDVILENSTKVGSNHEEKKDVTEIVTIDEGSAVLKRTNGVGTNASKAEVDAVPNFKLDVQPVHFDGYTVYRLVPQDQIQLEYLWSLKSTQNQPILYDFWKHPAGLGDYVDINVPPENKEKFVREVKRRNIKSVVLIEDLEQEIHNITAQGPAAEDPTDRNQHSFFLDYRSYGEIVKHIDQLVYKYNSKEKGLLVSKHKIGLSSEKRDLYVLEITTATETPKKSIWLDAGMHAREWIAPPTLMYIVEELLRNYKDDDNTTEILEHFTIFAMPMVNPDGYEYSRLTNRMWRKTRSIHRDFSLNGLLGRVGGCVGVDPNRNFRFQWGTAGASLNCAMDTYAGPSPFSEPETRALSDFVYTRREHMLAYLTFHAYSQLWMTPWGYTNALPPNYNNMIELANKATKALTAVHGTRYRTGSSTTLLYAASGGSDDWAHGVAKIPYAYTIELRDDGRYGFLLPTSQIIPTGEETWAGVKILLQELVSRKNEKIYL